jgi:hypothetical protein
MNIGHRGFASIPPPAFKGDVVTFGGARTMGCHYKDLYYQYALANYLHLIMADG